MKKSFFKIAACLSVLAALAPSCKLEEIDTQMTDEEAIAAIRLECDALEAYTIQAEKPQAVSFSVSSTTPWTIIGIPDWLTVTPTSSAESSLAEDILIKATANADYADRVAKLTVKGENTEILHQITITQLRKAKLVVTPVTGDFPKSASTLPFTVEANLAWEITSADPWLTFSQSKGEGSTSVMTIQAQAEQNKSIVRSTHVTVVCGPLTEGFDVTQAGEFLEFLPLESPAIDRKGGELELGVKASLDWTVETDNPAFTATKVGNDKVRVSAPFNNKFAPRTANIILKPASDDFGEVFSSMAVSQAINFTLQNCEVLEDGSVKMSGSAGSRVVTVDEFRDNFDLTLHMGEKHFGTAGQLWVQGKVGEVNIYNQLSLGGNTRIRTDGTMVNGASGYKSSTYSITQDQLNAMETYRYMIATNAADATMMDMAFYVDGALIKSHTGPNPFAYDEGSTTFYFGFYSSTTDGSWYVVESCDIQ